MKFSNIHTRMIFQPILSQGVQYLNFLAIQNLDLNVMEFDQDIIVRMRKLGNSIVESSKMDNFKSPT